MPLKNNFLAVLLAGSIILSSCSFIPVTPVFEQSEKNSPKGVPDSGYGINFSTKAISLDYLKRKINTWLGSDGPKLVKEINYSMTKHPQLLRDVVASQPEMYPGILVNTEVSARMAAIPAFSEYIYSLDPNPVQGNFSTIQSIDSSGAYQLEPFEIGPDHFIMINNYKDSSANYNINSVVYKWDGSQFVPVQSIATHGSTSVKPFTIDGSFYIAVSNLFNGSSYFVDSKIYHWNGTEFVEFQSLTGTGSVDFDFITIGTEHYLASANFSNGSTRHIDSKIYKWTGAGFAEFKYIPTIGATDAEFIRAGNEIFVAFTNSDDNTPGNHDALVYKWDGTSFNLFQNLPTKIAYETESFEINGETYLAAANLYDHATGGSVGIDIYKYGGNVFSLFQSIPNAPTEDLEAFKIGGIQYLAGSNSKLYKWDGSAFIEFKTITTDGGAAGYKYFSIGQDNYLAGAHPGGISSIYKLN
jgi:hypothetical protein